MALDHRISDDEAELLVNEVRVLLQHRTCCPDHAMAVLGLVAVGFAFDQTDYAQPRQAANGIRKAFEKLARRVERGDFKMIRGGTKQ